MGVVEQGGPEVSILAPRRTRVVASRPKKPGDAFDPWRLGGDWPLVGRDQELKALSGTLGRPNGGVMLTGEAGVGKTRLAREVLRLASAAGLPTAWATGTLSARSIPLGALAHLLPASAMSGETHPLALSGRALVGLGTGPALVLAIDDAHLLDDSSATLIHGLAVIGRLALVLTVRSAEAEPDAVHKLWKDNVVERLELRPLCRRDLDELLRVALGAEVDGITGERLWSATLGNTLLARELVRAGRESGVLAQKQGIWHWSGPLVGGSRLLAIMELRLEALSANERDALELVAVAEALESEVLDRLVAPDARVALERSGLLVDRQDSGVAISCLAHPLYREMVCKRMGAARLRHRCAQLADALGGAALAGRGDLLRVATLRLEAGGGGSPELFTSAATEAQAGYAPALAERLARAAIASGGGIPAEHVLGVALAAQGNHAEAIVVLAGALYRAPDDASRAMLAGEYAAALFYAGRPAEAAQVVNQAESAITDPSASDQLVALRARLLLYSGDLTSALSMSMSILDRAEGTLGFAGYQAASAAATALTAAGKTTEAISLIDRWSAAGLKGLLSSGSPVGLAYLQSFRGRALLAAGRLHELRTFAESSYRSAVDQCAHQGIAFWSMMLGVSCLDRGQVRTAIRWLRESALMTGDLDPVGIEPCCMEFLAQALALVGDLEAAEVALDASHRPCPGVPPWEFGRAAVWVAAVRGELSRARELALELATKLAATGASSQEALVLHDLVRLGDPRAVVDRLVELSRCVDGPITAIYAAHAEASCATDGGRLDQVAGGFEDIGALLLAAEARAEAGRAYTQAGREASARASEVQSAVLAGRCEGARTPALAGIGHAVPLTRRELEIALLAASGLSSREISERLYLSVRTVDTHLAHVFTKLGVNDRKRISELIGT